MSIPTSRRPLRSIWGAAGLAPGRVAGPPLAQEGWPAAATRELEARAAIMEIHGGLNRPKAEASAAVATRVWWARVRVE